MTVKLLAVVSTDTYVALSLDELPERRKTVALYVLAPSGHGKDYIINKSFLSDKAIRKMDWSTLKPGRWYIMKCDPFGNIVSLEREKVHPPEELVPPVLLDDLFEVDRVDEEIIDIDLERW